MKYVMTRPWVLVLGIVGLNIAVLTVLWARTVQAQIHLSQPMRFDRVTALPTCSQTVNKGRTVALIGPELPFHCTGVHWRPLTTGVPVSAFSGQRVGGHTLNNLAVFMTFTPAIYGKLVSLDATSIADGDGAGNVTIEIVQGATTLCSFTAACTIGDNTPITPVTCADNTIVPSTAVQVRYANSSNCTKNPAFAVNGVVDFLVPSP